VGIKQPRDIEVKGKIILSTLVVFIVPLLAFSQEFGGNPPSIRWNQIDTDTVRVIYPVSLYEEAQRVAGTIHYLSRNTRKTIGDKHQKIDIVLQNQTVFSNGYVGLAPFRSELYMNAPQNGFDLGSNWLDLLSIHEYRHALQFMNTRRGVTNIGYILTGEFGWSYLSNLSIPNWFWEGDAVVSETVLTEQGRGRLPSFYNGYKSLVYGNKTYNYQKARNGSIKDYVPNHYALGFLLCNYGREQYNNDFWKGVITDASRFKGLFYPFSKAIKRQTNLPVKGFYNKAIDHYQSTWESVENSLTQVNQLNTQDKKSTFTSYQYPSPVGDGSILAHKASFKKIGGFYVIERSGKESFIARQGRVVDTYFSHRNDKLLWAELGQDLRWSWKSYSNIVLYDIKSKQRKRITKSSRYFSPDLSHDGNKVIVFHVEPDQKYNLEIISSENGELITKIPNKENYYFSYPKWSDGDSSVIAIARDQRGKVAILEINVSNGSHDIILPFTNHQIGVPAVTKERIYFSASFSGVDNIYAIDRKNKKLSQITDGSLGAYQAGIDKAENKLYYSEFSSMGNNIKFIDIDELKWKNVIVVEPAEMEKYNFISVEEEGGDVTSKIPPRSFETKKYPLSAKLINLHSWSFYFADPNYEWALRSDNILNTLSMNLGVRYNRNDENFTYFFDAAYAQYFPVVTFSTSIGQRKTNVFVEDDEGNIVGTEQLKWWESIIKPGITIPFDISSELYARKINLSGFYSYTKVNYSEASEALDPRIVDADFHSYTASINFLNRRKKARQNILSSYSQYLSVSYDRLIDNKIVDQLFADSEWTFPGLFPNHNVAFQASFQKEDADNLPRYGDNFVYARGYNRPIYDYIYKIGSNYHLPVFYPDWGFWGIIYLYRLRANAFYDYSRTHFIHSDTSAESIQLYNSVGGELILDTKIMNMYDFTFGFRYSYLLNEDQFEEDLKHSFEVFIPLMRF